MDKAANAGSGRASKRKAHSSGERLRAEKTVESSGEADEVKVEEL